MRTSQFASLCQFCADQYFAFRPEAWAHTSDIESRLLALAANYLALSNWYDHEVELATLLASPAMTIWTNSDYYREAEEVGLDLLSLATGVRERIAEGRAADTGTSPEQQKAAPAAELELGRSV